jgi:hypothetical protein
MHLSSATRYYPPPGIALTTVWSIHELDTS